MDKDEKKQKKEELEQEVFNESDETKESNGEPNEDLLQQLEEVDQKYKRALADYQNLQRRTLDEKREWARLSNKELVLKLLPILDTLMLAEKHTQDKNFTLAASQFLQVLRDEGIQKIPTVGEMFDPMLMEAVETREGDEHTVLEEVKAGFILGDVVIRPAYVVVGKGQK